MMRSIFVLLCALSLAACGFQLRGQADLPPQMARTHIAGTSTDEGLGLELVRLLKANGVTLVSASEEAGTVVTFTRINATRKVLSVGDTAKVREYELILTVSFRAASRDESLVFEDQTLTLTRRHLHDPTSVLGSSQTESVLREDMERDAAQLVLYRLAAAGR